MAGFGVDGTVAAAITVPTLAQMALGTDCLGPRPCMAPTEPGSPRNVEPWCPWISVDVGSLFTKLVAMGDECKTLG